MRSKHVHTSYVSGWYFKAVLFYLIFTLLLIVFTTSSFESWRFFTEKSQSMSPTIDTGSLLLVVKKPSYEVNDIISFYSLEAEKVEIVTHRIIRLGGNVYVTKGDANEATDQKKVVPRLIIGSVALTIPKLGYIITALKLPAGIWFAVILPAILIVIKEVISILQELTKKP
ncbi:MAG: signal peptidase I [bacterium]